MKKKITRVQLLSQQSHTVSPEFKCFLQSTISVTRNALLTCISVANRNSAKLIWFVPYLDCPSVSSSHVSENRHSNYARILSPPPGATPARSHCFVSWLSEVLRHNCITVGCKFCQNKHENKLHNYMCCTGTIESQLQSILRSRTLLLKTLVCVTLSWILEHNFPSNSVHMGKRYVET
jgi:hypothetical protein